MARERLSRGDLLLLNAILAAGGAGVSAYLTYEKLVAFSSSFCDINDYFSCSAVGASSFAAIGPVPTAVVGLAGFLLLLALSIAAFRGTVRLGPWSVDGWTLVLAIVGGLLGLGLTFVEVFVIHAVCILCATGFALDLGILAVAVVLRRRGEA